MMGTRLLTRRVYRRFDLPLSPTERKQRAKEARDKDRHAEKDKPRDPDKLNPRIKLPSASPNPLASTSASALTPAPPLPPLPARKLAGVAAQTEAITRQVVGALLTRQLGAAGATVPAPGIVLGGLAGAGKTALVRQLADELAVDRRAMMRELAEG